jgi:uncharacterized Zn finger protein
MKKLLICPNCFSQGKKEVLGELDEEGNLVIMRFHNGTTKVISPLMMVKCGKCGEVVFYRKPQNFTYVEQKQTISYRI